jgi:hypothetical protein
MTDPTQSADDVADRIAKWFHFYYEGFAPDFGYATRLESRVPWQFVAEANRKLMTTVVATLIEAQIIEPGPNARIDGQVSGNLSDESGTDA